MEASTPALREGRILQERVSREDPGVQGVAGMVSFSGFFEVNYCELAEVDNDMCTESAEVDNGTCIE